MQGKKRTGKDTQNLMSLMDYQHNNDAFKIGYFGH